MMFFWAVLGLSAILARASPLPPTQCDGVNCFVILTSAHGAHDWTPQQLASAVPAKLLEIEVESMRIRISLRRPPAAQILFS